VHDDKDKEFELELSMISAETGYEHRLVPHEQMKDIDHRAKKAIADEEELVA
jgi:hypothetical protein